MIFILLKAEQVSLFDATVPVKGHSSKTGTYVSPYQARRKKRLPEPPVSDLFGETEPAPEPKPVIPVLQPEPEPKPVPTMIVGHTWDEIQAAQQKKGSLHPTVDTTQPGGPSAPTQKDLDALEKYGEQGLRDEGLFGIIDRLTGAGVIKPAPAPEPEPKPEEKAANKALTPAQKNLIDKIKEGATLFMGKQVHNYGQYFLRKDGQKEKVNATTVYGLERTRHIAADQVGNLEVTYKLAAEPPPQQKKETDEDRQIREAYQKGKEITGETGKISMRGILGKQTSRMVGTVEFEGVKYGVKLIHQHHTGRVTIGLVDKKTTISATHVADDQPLAHGMGALLATLNPAAILHLDMDRTDPETRKVTEAEKQAAKEAKAAEKEMMNMRAVRGALGGSPEPQPWDQTDLQDYRDRERMLGITYKGAGIEHSINLRTEQLRADPRKWKVGQGVAWKATMDQINRGYRIMAVDVANKTVRIRSIADTGITVTGGDHDHLQDEIVHIAWILSDKKYDPSPMERVKPAINTNEKTISQLLQIAQGMGIQITPNPYQSLARQRQSVLDAITEHQKNAVQ